VIAGNRIDGHAERLECGAEAFVAGATLVLHDVAGRENRVDGPATIALRVLEHGQQRGVRRHAAHATVGSCVQVRIADLQKGEGRCLAGHDARCTSTGERKTMIRNYRYSRGECLTEHRRLKLRHLYPLGDNSPSF
jgi:hypothetical protein